jgi:hypothetical protein
MVIEMNAHIARIFRFTGASEDASGEDVSFELDFSLRRAASINRSFNQQIKRGWSLIDEITPCRRGEQTSF